MTYSVLKKIANSIGVENILDELGSVADTPATKIISLMARLENRRQLPGQEIKALAHTLKGHNEFAYRLVRQALVQHLYLHEVTFQEKQMLASVTGIGLEFQRKLALKGKDIS